MPSIRIDKSASALGRTVSYTRTVTSDGGVLVEPSLAERMGNAILKAAGRETRVSYAQARKAGTKQFLA